MDLQIDRISGFCPVQGYGTLDGLPLYFRGRSDLTLSIAASPEGDPVDAGVFGPGWELDLEPLSTDEDPYFGYLSKDRVRELIRLGCTAWVEYRETGECSLPFRHRETTASSAEIADAVLLGGE